MEKNKKSFAEELLIGERYAIDELLEEKDSVMYKYLVEITKRQKNAVELFDNVSYIEEAVICELLRRVYDNLFDSEKLDKIYPDNERVAKLQKTFMYLRKKFDQIAYHWHPSIPSTSFNRFLETMMLVCNNSQEKLDNFAIVNKRVADVRCDRFVEEFYYYGKFYATVLKVMENFDSYISLTDDELRAKLYESVDEAHYFDGYFDVVDNKAYEWFLQASVNDVVDNSDYEHYGYYDSTDYSDCYSYMKSSMKCLFENNSSVSDSEIDVNKALIKTRIMKKLEE